MTSPRCAFVLLLLAALQLPVSGAPTITAPQVISITGTTATLTATVTAGGSATTTVFSYGETTAYGNSVPGAPSLATNDSNVLVSGSLTGLTAGTTYQFKVAATSTAGTTTTRNLTFKQQTDSPTLTISADPTHSGNTATVHGSIFTAGVAGDVYFKYGATNAYGMETAHTAVAANSQIAIDLPLTPAGVTYHYQLFFENAGSTLTVGTPDAVNNQPPKAVADSVSLVEVKETTIDVLANDTDPESDALTLVSVTTPKSGTAAISGTAITYTPGANFRDGDSFSYTIQDSFGATSTATVTVRTLRSSLAGTHGGLIKKANGKEIGYFKLTTNATGAFTGFAFIDGKRYLVTGVIGADGSFQGFGSNGTYGIPFSLATATTTSGSTITATFDSGKYTADLSVSPTEGTTRTSLTGRYTAALAAGGSSLANGTDGNTQPEGPGWLEMRVWYDGTASVKGRLSDGRMFTTAGTVNIDGGASVLSFYDDPTDTRVIGNITLGDTVSGTVHTDRSKGDDKRFPGGFDVSQTVAGAFYTPPTSGKRTLDTDTTKANDLTISFSGGNLTGTLSRDLVTDDEDRVTVVNGGREDLKVKIDRKSGYFQAKVTIDNEGTRIKANGVLVQGVSGGSGTGTGIFTTATNTGSVTIATTGSSSATTTTTTTTGTTTTTTTP